MEIREASEEDIPAIVRLLKASLGETLLLKSEEFWRWKHVNNPFGRSPVLLAYEGDSLIGVRAFLSWKFTYDDNVIQAYRAVDTATHPHYTGKGIFTKLTMELVNMLKGGPPSFIFNTPNQKSLPGYLKMGWKVAGKTRLYLRPHPLNFFTSLLSKHQHVVLKSFEIPEDLMDIIRTWSASHHHLLTTQYTPEYFAWRYQQVPGLQYGVHVANKKGSKAVVIFRIKLSGRLRELRITDLFYEGAHAREAVHQAFNDLTDQYVPHVTTILCDTEGVLSSLLPFGFFNAESKGLIITCREVNDPDLSVLVFRQEKWAVSAGALELF